MPAPFIMVTAPAKVNLYLGVYPELDERGYHRVDSVMTAIDLVDTVAMAPSDDLMVKMVPDAGIPMDDNSAAKAARAMGTAFGRDPHFTIVIDKHIPAGSGLGGPSADAAAVIMGICHFWEIDPLDPRIDEVARGCGADVPFFLYGPPAYLSGGGDRMEETFRPLTGTSLALVKPWDAHVSSAEAYRLFDEAQPAAGPLEPLLDALRRHDETDIFASLSNNLEPVACAAVPEIAEIMAWLAEQPDVRAVRMTGSGSCAYAVCNTAMAAEKIALAALNEKNWWAQAAKMMERGPYIAVG